MRVWPVAVALSIVSQAVSSQPADNAISRSKACFQLERAPQSECFENLSRELADKNNQKSAEPAARSWVVSETMSPVDYSPMISATTSSQFGRERCTRDLHDPLSRPAHGLAGQHGRIVARLASQTSCRSI